MRISKQITIDQQGIASLPIVMVLLGLLVTVGLLISSISLSNILTVANFSDTEKAIQLAELGARDAMQKITRDKDYSGNYSIAIINDGCSAPFDSCITVSVDSSSTPKIVSSSGQVKNFIRKIKVYVYLDSNGLITDYDWQEF